MRTTLIVLVLGTTTAAATAQTPGFHLVGLSPGATYGRVYSLSQDGSVAAGVNASVPTVAYTWTAAGGRNDFGLQSGAPHWTTANGMNSDGSVVVGSIALQPTQAYRRIGNGPLESLGVLSGHNNSYATAVSGDGETVVGYARLYGGNYGTTLQVWSAFRWTAATGMQSLGIGREATAISRDGSTVTLDRGEVWRASTGVVSLPPLPAAPYPETGAQGVNADGTVIVGVSSFPGSSSRAVRWTASGVEDLGVLPGFSRSNAFAVDDSGDVIGGQVSFGGGPYRAFVWTPSQGMSLLSEYLDLHGVSVPLDFHLEKVYAISGDGLTFAGEARSSSGVRQGFVATIPAPSGMLVVFSSALLIMRRRRRSTSLPQHSPSPSRILSATVVLAATAAATAQTPGFHLVGSAPNSTTSWVSALSQNGGIAVGGHHTSGGGAPGFTWTATTGRDDFGLSPGMPLQTAAMGVDSSGTTLVGFMGDHGANPFRAYRRVGNGPFENLGVLPGDSKSFANAVSGDGSVVVGRSERYGGNYGTTLISQSAFRWTAAGGMQLLDIGLLEATAVSRDGSTVTISRGKIWREATGLQYLPALPGTSPYEQSARGVNADGSIIVGRGANAAGQSRAIRWTPSGPEELPTLLGANAASAYAVSDDGDVIGGSTRISPNNHAFVWTPGGGSVLLTDLLSSSGIAVPPEWRPEYIYAISGDGLTFAGEARSTSGVRQGFVATIPAPSGMIVVFSSALLVMRRRRQ
jgi:probable HAF family extracellular repeat protein